MDKQPNTEGHECNRHAGVYDWSWFPKGAANLFSLPALILVSAFVGFGGLAREAGIPLAQLIFMVPTIWALPSHLVLVSGMVSNASLIAVALAVALASIRMMPMTMALLPEIRSPGSRQWHLFLVSNFVAVTAWLHTLEKAPEIPREGRLPYFVGFAATMMVTVTVVASVVHQLAAAFPPLMLAALYFLTPIYFATSIWSSMRANAERYALVFGLILGPAFHGLFPQTNILFAGVIGGVTAFAGHWFFSSRSAK